MWCSTGFNIVASTFYYIYMNDICNESELLFSMMYPDNTSVQISRNNMTSLVSSLNAELELLSRCLARHGS